MTRKIKGIVNKVTFEIEYCPHYEWLKRNKEYPFIITVSVSAQAKAGGKNHFCVINRCTDEVTFSSLYGGSSNLLYHPLTKKILKTKSALLFSTMFPTPENMQEQAKQFARKEYIDLLERAINL